MALACWNGLLERYDNIELDKFVVMPNHIHGIIKIIDHVGAIHELPLQNANHTNKIIERRRMLIPKVVGYFKMNSSKQINTIRNSTGIPVWQRNYYEHIIRNEDKFIPFKSPLTKGDSGGCVFPWSSPFSRGQVYNPLCPLF